MSDYLNNVSLKYLVNDVVKEKIEESDYHNKKIKTLNKDKKFYKNRILSSIKEILLNKETILHPDIQKQINSTFSTLISHFKEIDKIDIMQNEYNDLVLVEENKPIGIDIDTKQFDNLCMKKVKPTGLDQFVKITKKEKPAIDYPKKKKFKIKTDEYRTKGIKKKKNININYDEKEQKKTERRESS